MIQRISMLDKQEGTALTIESMHETDGLNPEQILGFIGRFIDSEQYEMRWSNKQAPARRNSHTNPNPQGM